MTRYKLAILASHPIQYQAPLFEKLAEHPKIDLMVYFCTDRGVKEKKDPDFGVSFKWDISLLDGYKYKFLKNYSLKPYPSFSGQINPGIIFELRENRYDAIIVDGWIGITNWFVFLNRTPIFLRSENPLSLELLKPFWKIKIKKKILGKLFKKVKAFLFLSKENKKFYLFYGVPKEKLFFTPYAVDNERFNRDFSELRDKKNELRWELGINQEKIVILFCGKLIDKKRPLDLLFAYEKIKNPNKTLVYVGDGHLRAKIEDYVKKKNLEGVYLIGFKNQTELPFYYIVADIFVLPSGGETWGVVVNEAMCFQLPVVVSNLVGCGPHLVKNNENGYIFPRGDIDKLTFYLEDLIRDGEKRRAFGERSFELIQNYNYEEDIEVILKALESEVK